MRNLTSLSCPWEEGLSIGFERGRPKAGQRCELEGFRMRGRLGGGVKMMIKKAMKWWKDDKHGGEGGRR